MRQTKKGKMLHHLNRHKSPNAQRDINVLWAGESAQEADFKPNKRLTSARKLLYKGKPP